MLAPAVAQSSSEHAKVAQAALAFETQLTTMGLVEKEQAKQLEVYVADFAVNKINRHRQELVVRARDILVPPNKNVVTVEQGTEPGALFDLDKLNAEEGFGGSGGKRRVRNDLMTFQS